MRFRVSNLTTDTAVKASSNPGSRRILNRVYSLRLTTASARVVKVQMTASSSGPLSWSPPGGGPRIIPPGGSPWSILSNHRYWVPSSSTDELKILKLAFLSMARCSLAENWGSRVSGIYMFEIGFSDQSTSHQRHVTACSRFWVFTARVCLNEVWNKSRTASNHVRAFNASFLLANQNICFYRFGMQGNKKSSNCGPWPSCLVYRLYRVLRYPYRLGPITEREWFSSCFLAIKLKP